MIKISLPKLKTVFLLALLFVGIWQIRFLINFLNDRSYWWTDIFYRNEQTAPSVVIGAPKSLFGEILIKEPLEPCVVNFDEVRLGEEPQRITIPTVSIDLEVRSVPLVDGTWVVYDYVANYAQGTSLANGVAGNTGIFGHDRPQAFNRLKKISLSDAIIVLTATYRFEYRAAEIITGINPTEVDVFLPTAEPQLTLLTCDGVLSRQRFVIKANLARIERRGCQPD